jgi:hypothetical protein
MVEPNKSGLGPRASQRLVLLQLHKLAEAVHDEGRRLTGASRSICLGKNFELEPPAFVFPGVDFFRPAGE